MPSAHSQTVEHIVLLNVKPDVDSTKVATMIDEINGLASLGLTIYLSVGKLFRCPLNFTHILHCRYTSKDNLQLYYDHPQHLRVVAENIQPLIDNAMTLDWISEGISDSSLKQPGSVMRVTFLKLKEDDLVEHQLVVESIKNEFKTSEEVSVGENFSPEMAQGYSIAMIHIFPDLEAFDSDADHANNLHLSKVKDLIDIDIVVDYRIGDILIDHN